VGSNPTGSAYYKKNLLEGSVLGRSNSRYEIDIQNVQLEDLTKLQLVELRKKITNILNSKYPNCRKSKYFVPIEDRIPSDKELQLILTATNNPKYRLFFKLLAYTGCRPVEAVSLKLEDLDIRNRCFYVWVAKKNYPVRLAKYFPSKLVLDLEVWIKTRREEIECHNGSIFYNNNSNSHISVTEASKVFREAVDKLSLDKFYAIAEDRNNPYMQNNRKLRNYSLRNLRKYFVSKVYDSSNDGMIASKMLHHSHVDITGNYYVGVSKEKKLKVLDKSFE